MIREEPSYGNRRQVTKSEIFLFFFKGVAPVMDEDDEVVDSTFDWLDARKDVASFGLVFFCLQCVLILGLRGLSVVYVGGSLLVFATAVRYAYVKLSMLLGTRNTHQYHPFRLRALRNEGVHEGLAWALAWLQDALSWKQTGRSLSLIGGLLLIAVLLQWTNLLVLLYVLGMLVLVKVNYRGE